MTSDQDKKFVLMAIEQAHLARKSGNMPFGAVLVKNGKLIVVGQNQVHTQNDHTYHAELGLIRNFCHSQRTLDLSDYTLYTSCEPCVMCACAMIWVKLGRLVYSVRKEVMDKYAGKIIDVDCEQLFRGSAYRPEVLGDVLTKEGERVFDGYIWK